jgi:hypothetical protein
MVAAYNTLFMARGRGRGWLIDDVSDRRVVVANGAMLITVGDGMRMVVGETEMERAAMMITVSDDMRIVVGETETDSAAWTVRPIVKIDSRRSV